MKTITKSREQGSVLMMALLTITVLTLICATSLFITTQNGNATTQTTSWQQALAGAEAAADQAMNALNKSSWTNWYQVSGSLPSNQPNPSGSPSASGPPDSSHYNYYSITPFSLQGEASNSVAGWVTVDTAGLGTNQNGQQPYRIRAVGVVGAPGPPRTSNQKLDNDLRKIALKYDRFSSSGAGTISTPQAIRRIEIIALPVASGGWGLPNVTKSWISMSGSGVVDSFDSSNSFKSTNHLYDAAKRQSHGDIATTDSTNSDLRNTYVYGNIQYSGPAIKNTTNVQGTISSPYAATIPTPQDPTTSNPNYWQNDNLGQSYPTFTLGSYTQYSGGGNPPTTVPANTFTISGNSSNPTLIKVSGDFTVPGGKSFSIVPQGGASNRVVIIWVTGKFTTSGSGYITQDPNVKVIWIVDNDITVSGDSYQNQSGYASKTSFVGVGNNNKVTDSGSANFIGTMYAPGYDITISGSGSFCGALVGDTLTISGSAGLHYDEALKAGGGNGVSNFSYASWFEDNSDPKRGSDRTF